MLCPKVVISEQGLNQSVLVCALQQIYAINTGHSLQNYYPQTIYELFIRKMD